MLSWVKEVRLLCVVQLSFVNVIADSVAMNCSNLCTCSERSLKGLINSYNHKYAVDLTIEEDTANQTGQFLKTTHLHNLDLEPRFWYSFLFPSLTYLNDIQSIVEVNCQLDDDKYHFVSDLLNNIHLSRYTAIKVECHGKEDVILDVSMVNIVEIENCRVRSHGKNYQLPVDLWVLDIQNNREHALDHLRVNSAKNMFAFVIANMSSEDLLSMKEWQGISSISSNIIGFRSSKLTSFSCPFSKDKQAAQVIGAVDLRDNRLTSVPECLVQPGAAISRLSLSHNHISNISALTIVGTGTRDPDSSLEFLDLSNNLIKELKTFNSMPKLHTLDLRHNRIENIGNNKFSRLITLQRLYLQHNLIHRVVNLVGPDSLRFVNLSNNQIEKITIDPAMNSLAIDVRKNNLRLPPWHDCDNTSLPTSGLQLWASGNPFTCSCEATGFQRCMEWIRNQGRNVADVFVDVYHMTCSHPAEARGQTYPSLFLQSQCVLHRHCPDSCDCHFNGGVITVNCSARNMLEMPFNIPLREDATAIKLLLDHNPIQILGPRSYLPHVTHLALHHCMVTHVAPHALTHAAHLTHLTLHRNRLSRLPKTIQIATLPNLKNITLHNNRWECSCSSLWLAEWMRGLGGQIHQPDSVICSNRGSPVARFNCIGAVVDTAFWGLVTGGLLALGSCVWLVYLWRSAINTAAFSCLGLRLWPPITHGGDHCIYDVFLLHSRASVSPLVHTLVQRLEASRLRLCLLCRDLPSFAAAAHSLPVALHVSRCCVLLVSQDFLRYEWTVPGLRQLLETELRTSGRVVLVLCEDVQGCQLPEPFLATLHRHPTLTQGEADFWGRLMYLMPAPRLTESRSLQFDFDSGDGCQKEDLNTDCPKDGKSIYEDCVASDGGCDGCDGDRLSIWDQLSDGDNICNGGRSCEEDMPLSGWNRQNNQGEWVEGLSALDGDVRNERRMVLEFDE